MKYEKISLLCQSYARPEEYQKMVDGALANAAGPIEFLVGLDAADPLLEKYVQEPRMVKLVTPPDDKWGEVWNKLAAAATGDLFMMCSDDSVFHTSEWDLRIRNYMEFQPECKSGIFVAWVDDGTVKSRNHCQAPIISRRWYESLGYYTSEDCGEFSALWLWDVGRQLDCLVYIDEVLIEAPEREVDTPFEDFERNEPERERAAGILRGYMEVTA